MEQNDKNFTTKNHGSRRIFTGLFLLAIGVLILAQKIGAPIPDWLLSWHTLLIALGLFVGIKSNFRNPGWIIMVVIGGFFLADDIVPGIDLHNFIAPAILITIGAFFIFKPKTNWKRSYRWNKRKGVNYDSNIQPAYYEGAPDGEYIEVNAVFRGAKKMVLSKNFKGGELNSFMGGTEVNFLQADIQTPVILEVNAVFGGAKLIVPSNWDVKNEITAVFGGIEDKRSINAVIPDQNKSLILRGTCVFGGIEINNF